jgi:hypothetical protein
MQDSFYLRSPRTLEVEYSYCCYNQPSFGEGELLELRGKGMITITIKKWVNHCG